MCCQLGALAIWHTVLDDELNNKFITLVLLTVILDISNVVMLLIIRKAITSIQLLFYSCSSSLDVSYGNSIILLN